ncbi:GerAB/ArcD/ProY family transporter, partial [Bacillus sp. JJ722]|uniref:GerAB/ArcD/ProY family transporter n=1 Tax=Bacillus sp. JJ722 TaxID=3122973 RepID=UPI002FFF6255
MQKELIGSFQIIVLIILFQLGTSTFLGIGKEAGKDFWIAVIISTVLGIGLLYLYISIYSLHQDHTFNEILIAGFGRFLGNLIGILYALYFLYIAAR